MLQRLLGPTDTVTYRKPILVVARRTRRLCLPLVASAVLAAACTGSALGQSVPLAAPGLAGAASALAVKPQPARPASPAPAQQNPQPEAHGHHRRNVIIAAAAAVGGALVLFFTLHRSRRGCIDCMPAPLP